MHIPQKKRYKLTSDPGLPTRAALPPHLVLNGVEAIPSVQVSQRRSDGVNVKGKKQGERGSTLSNERPTIKREVAVAKLRLYLAQRMLQAVRCSPNGGFGVPVDCVRQEMTKEFGSQLVDGLFGEASANAVILSECGDVVELMPLRVQQLTKNGCVPSIQFRRDSTNMEARIREDALEIIAKAEEEDELWRLRHPHAPSPPRPESTVENRHPETNPPHLPQKGMVEGSLIQKVRQVLRDMMSEALTERSQFPSTLDFVEQFKKKVGSDLDPLASGFPSVLEMLRNMNLEDLVWFTEYDGTMYLVPSSQAYNKYHTDAHLDSRNPIRNSIPREIPPPPPRPKESTPESRTDRTTQGIRHLQPSPPLPPPSVAEEDELDEFDVEILNKMRDLFNETVCKDRRPISLNRLPLIFLRRCGTVLDYHKYGFINLADVVALLEDTVKVTDSDKGKIIVPTEKPKPLGNRPSVTDSEIVPRTFGSGPSHGHASAMVSAPSVSANDELTGTAVMADTVIWPPNEQSSVHPTRWAAVYPGSIPVPPALHRPRSGTSRTDPHNSRREYRA